MQVVIVHDPFHPLRGREIKEYKKRKRLSTLAPKVNKPFICVVNGEAVLRADWGRTVGKDDSVAFVMLPQGGGGSNPLRMILMLAVMIYAPVLAGNMAWASVGSTVFTTAGLSALTSIYTAGLMMVGSMLVNALIPPPKPPSFASNAGPSPSPTYNLQAQGNSARLEQPIPVQYGRMRVFPDFVSQPYVEYKDNEQYLFQLMCIGQGRYTVEDIQIEDTTISSFSEVEYELLSGGQKPRLFPANVTQATEVSGQEMDCKTGTYAQSGATVTVTYTDHNVTNGQSVYLDFTSGTATNGTFTVTSVPTADTFTVTHGTSTTTSGAVNFSVWVGPFAANAVETKCADIGIDLVCPKGLYYANDNGSLASKSAYVKVEGRLIDQDGNPLGEWQTLVTDDNYGPWSAWASQGLLPNLQSTFSLGGYSTKPTITRTAHGFVVGERLWVSLNNLYYYSEYNDVQSLWSGEAVVASVPDANTFTIQIPRYLSRGAMTNYPAQVIDITLNQNTVTDEYEVRYETQTVNNGGDYITSTTGYFLFKRSRSLYAADAIGLTGATATAIRNSYKLNMASFAGGQVYPRFEIRLRRVDVRAATTRDAHDVVWAGLRAYLPDEAEYGDITMIAIKARASNNLSAQGSRKINLVATRALPAVVTTGGLAGTPVQQWSIWEFGFVTRYIATPTRSIAVALADACMNTTYGAGLLPARIDWDQLVALDALWTARGDTFDGRFDNALTFWEALNQIAKAGRAKCFMQGGIMHFVRDTAATVPVALFSMRNIVKGSFSVQYLTPTDETADAVEVSYFDSATWKPQRLTAELPDSSALKPAKIELFGVTGREQAYREATYYAAANHYRRKLIKFSTEAEGFIPSFGDLIAIQHDMPQWGQHAEVAGWVSGTKTMIVSEPMTFTAGQTHYVGLRKRDGSVDGPYTVTAGADAYTLVFATLPAITPYYGQSEERTHIAFGYGETWRQPARVVTVQPRGLYQVEITAINEDPSVHTADQGLTAPPIQYSELPTVVGLPVLSNLLVTASESAGGVRYVATWAFTSGAEHFIIEQSNDYGATWFALGDSQDAHFQWVSQRRIPFDIRVAGINIGRGDWLSTRVDFSAPPSDVETFEITEKVVNWSPVEDVDLAGYQIRWTNTDYTEWGQGVQLHGGLLTESPFELTHRPDGGILMIKAVDVWGNVSQNAAIIVLDLYAFVVSNSVASYDFGGAGYPGTKTNCSNSGSQVLADSSEVMMWSSNPAAAMWRGDGSPMWNDYTWLECAYYFNWTPPAIAGVASTIALAADVSGAPYKIEYRTIRTSFSLSRGTVTRTSAWMVWPGRVPYGGGRYEWRFTAGYGPTRGTINSLVAHQEVEERRLTLEDVSIAAGGTRLDIDTGWHVIRAVILTVQSDGGTAVGAKVIDKDATNGPLIKCIDATGAFVAGSVDADIIGY